MDRITILKDILLSEDRLLSERTNIFLLSNSLMLFIFFLEKFPSEYKVWFSLVTVFFNIFWLYSGMLADHTLGYFYREIKQSEKKEKETTGEEGVFTGLNNFRENNPKMFKVPIGKNKNVRVGVVKILGYVVPTIFILIWFFVFSNELGYSLLGWIFRILVLLIVLSILFWVFLPESRLKIWISCVKPILKK